MEDKLSFWCNHFQMCSFYKIPFLSRQSKLRDKLFHCSNLSFSFSLNVLLFICSVVSDYLWTHQASLSFTISHNLLKLMSIESLMPFNHPLLSPSLSAFNLSQCQVCFFFVVFFFNVLALHIRYQSSGASASASVYLMNIQDWFPLGLTGLISLQSNGFSRVFSNTTVQSIKSSAFSLLYGSTLTSIHDYWKKHSFVYTDLCQQKLCLSVFNTLSRFHIGFLLLGMCLRLGSLGSHHLQWFWSPRK